jgi:ketosteroid isomerase-like protein
MSVGEDEARQLVQRWFSIWGDGDINVVDQVCTDPYLRHTSIGSESISLEQYKKKLVQTRQALRDAVTTIDDQAVSGDRVWTRATSRGVNFATSEPAVVTWVVVHRIEAGRIAETWAATLAGTEWRPLT